MHNNVNQRLQRTANEQAAATSLRLQAAEKQSTESAKTPSMNRPATTQYLNIISYEQDEVGDVLARSMSKLKQSLSQAATTTAQQDSGMLDDSANQVDSQAEKMAVYSKLAGKIINRDQALQERVAQNLSTSKRLVRSRDAATSLQQAMDKLPAQLKEGTNAGRDLAKFMVENLVSLTDTKNMGAGLERDLAVRQVAVPKHQPNLRVQQASQKVLAASIAYIQSNQPEVLAALKNAPATSDNAAANTQTTAQAMTQYLHQALNEFPNDSTYLDIFKQNRSQQTNEGYADKMSEEIAQRIHDLIAKAANTAKSGNLIKLSPEEAANFERIVRDAQQHVQNNGLRSMERIFSQATTSTGAPVQNSTGTPNANAQANAAGASTVTQEQGTIINQALLSPAEEDALTEQALKVADRNTKNEHVRNLSLSDLSSRAAMLQEEFRAERQRMVQEGKLPNPAIPPQDNFADDEALFTKAQSSNRAQTGAQVEANSRVLNEALIKARSALESRISTPLNTEAKSTSTQQAQAANTQQAPASTSTTSNATNTGTTNTASNTTAPSQVHGQTLNQTAPAQSNAATAQQPAANATTQGAANATTASTSTPAQATAPQANANASNTINQTAQSTQQPQAQAQAQSTTTSAPAQQTAANTNTSSTNAPVSSNPAPAPAPETPAQGNTAANQSTTAPAPNTSAQQSTAPTQQQSAPQSSAHAPLPQRQAAEDRVTTLNFDQNTLHNTSLNLSYTAVQSSIYGDMDIMPGMTIPVSHFGDYTDGNMQPNKAALDALQQQAHRIYNQVRNESAPTPAPAPVVSDADETVQQQAQQNQQATQQAQRPATGTPVPTADGVIEAKPQAPLQQQQQPAQQTQQTQAPAQSTTTSQVVADGNEVVQQQQQVQQNQQATQQAQRPATATSVPADDGVIESKPQAPLQQQQPTQQTQQQAQTPVQSTTSQVVADGDEAVQQQQVQQNQQATQHAQRPATATTVPADDGVIESKPQAPLQQQQPTQQTQQQAQTPVQSTTSQVVADGDEAVQQQQVQQNQQATQHAQRPATATTVPADDGVIESKPQAPLQQQQPTQQTQQQAQTPVQSTTSQVVADSDEAVQQQQVQQNQQATQHAQRPATATTVPADDGVIESKPQAPLQQQQPTQQTQQQAQTPVQSTTSQVVADSDEAVQQQQVQQNQQATQHAQRPATATPVPTDDGVIEAKPQAPLQQQHQPAQQTQQQTPAPAQSTTTSQVVADGDEAVRQQQQVQQNQQATQQAQRPATATPVPADDGVIESKPQAPVQQQQPTQQAQQTQATAQSTTSHLVADGDETVQQQQQVQQNQQATQQAQRPATATPVPADDGVIESKPQAPVQQQQPAQQQPQTQAPAQSTTTSQVVADGDEAVQQQQQVQQNQQATQQAQRPATATPVPADDGVIESKPQAPVQQQQQSAQQQPQTQAPAQSTTTSQVVADGDEAGQQQKPAAQPQLQAPAQPQVVPPATSVAPETHTDPNFQPIGQTQHVLNGNFKSNMYARLYGNLQQENYAAAQIKQPTHRTPAPAEVEPPQNMRPQPAPAPQANAVPPEPTASHSPASPAQISTLEGSQSISTSYPAQTTHAIADAAAASKENASLESLQQANTVKAQLEINLDLPNEALIQAPVSANDQGRVTTQQSSPAPAPAPQPAAEDDSAFARLYQQAQQAGETARAERDAAQRTQANLAQEHAQQQIQTQRQQQQQAVIQQQQQTVANDKYQSAQQQVQQQIVADEQAAGGNTIGNTAIRATGTTLASAQNAILEEQASQPRTAPHVTSPARQGQVGTTQVEARTAAAGASQTVLADHRAASTQQQQQQQPVQQPQPTPQSPAPQQGAAQQQVPAAQSQPAPAPQPASQATQSPQPAPVQPQPNPSPQPQPAPTQQTQATASQPTPAPVPQQAQTNAQSSANPAPNPVPAPAVPTAPATPAAPNIAQVTPNGAPVTNTVPNSNTTVTTDTSGSGVSSLQGVTNVTNLAAVGAATTTGAATGAQASAIGSGAVNLNTNLSEDSLQDEIIKNVMQTVPSDELDADALQNNSLGQALSGVVADTDLTENQDSFDAILRKNQAAPQTVAMATPASLLPTNSTPGAAQITAGQSAPIPDETVINNTSAPRESSGLFRRLASFFGHHSDTVEDNAPPATATTAKSSMDPSSIALESAAQLQQKVQAQAPQQFSAFDHLMGRLQGATLDPELPPAMKEQAQKFLQALQNPVADLHSVSNWLNFVTGPLSPSSSQALALHQWAFMLLCIRFEQLGKNIERFLKKNGGSNAVKELGGEVKRTQSLFEAIDDKTVHKSNDLLKETFSQVERLQQQMQNLPVGQVLPRNVPLPPFYHGGQEGSMTAHRQQEEDGGSSWHLNFNFDLENLGPLQIKVCLRFPEVQISFVAERLETLQKVQENMPILNARLREIGLNSKGSSARLGRISRPEVKHDTASSDDNFKFEGPSFTTRA